MIRCPLCAEAIQDAAVFCKHCHQPLTPASNPTSSEQRPTVLAPNIALGGGAGTVSPTYAKAPFGSRVLASLFDTLIGAGPLVAVVTMLAVAAVAGSAEAAVGVGIVIGIPAFAWAIWYGFSKDGRPDGQSIGKKSMGLMVVHLPTRAPCSRGQSAIRALVMTGLSFVPYIGWLVEPVIALAATDGRRLGDKAADTQVVEARAFEQGMSLNNPGWK